MIWAQGHRNARLEQRPGGYVQAPITLARAAVNATAAIGAPGINPLNVAQSHPALAAKPAGHSTQGASRRRGGGY